MLAKEKNISKKDQIVGVPLDQEWSDFLFLAEKWLSLLCGEMISGEVVSVVTLFKEFICDIKHCSAWNAQGFICQLLFSVTIAYKELFILSIRALQQPGESRQSSCHASLSTMKLCNFWLDFHFPPPDCGSGLQQRKIFRFLFPSCNRQHARLNSYNIALL